MSEPSTPDPNMSQPADRQMQVERSRLERLLHARLDDQISQTESEELSELIGRHPRFATEVRRTRLNLDHLVLLPAAPDFTARVLENCGPEVTFASRNPRSTRRSKRLALAGAGMLALLALVVTHRVWPGWNGTSHRSEPLAQVLSAGQRDAGYVASTFEVTGRQLVQAFGAGMREPGDVPATALAAKVPLIPLRSLALGDTSRFDRPLSYQATSPVIMASQPPARGLGPQVFCADDQWLLASLRAAQDHRAAASPVRLPASEAMRAAAMSARDLPFESLSSESHPHWPFWPAAAD